MNIATAKAAYHIKTFKTAKKRDGSKSDFFLAE